MIYKGYYFVNMQRTVVSGSPEHTQYAVIAFFLYLTSSAYAHISFSYDVTHSLEQSIFTLFCQCSCAFLPYSLDSLQLCTCDLARISRINTGILITKHHANSRREDIPFGVSQQNSTRCIVFQRMESYLMTLYFLNCLCLDLLINRQSTLFFRIYTARAS